MGLIFLGAGASRHVGYPLASTMGAGILSWISKREAYANTADFLREEFGGSPNMEDVITELDARIKSLENPALTFETATSTCFENWVSNVGCSATLLPERSHASTIR